MASITERIKDGKAVYNVRIRIKGYPLQSATFSRLTDAKRWEQQTEASIREGRYFKTAEAKKHTLAELVDRYLKEEDPTYAYPNQLLHWKSVIGQHNLSDITPALIVEHRNKLASGITYRNTKRSPSTVNRYLAALSSAFTTAVKEWHWLGDNPLRKVKKYKEPRGRVRFLSDEERVELLDACKESENKDLYIAVVLALSTGARRMEILSLQWKDVSFEREMITIMETKNGEIRSIPLQGHALELVIKRNKIRRLDTDLIFPGKVHPNKPIDLRAPFERALKHANIEDFHWHDLRHSAASYLAMGGASLAEIAEVLGHKTLSMVKRYSHLSEAHTSKVVARMNQKIFGGE